MGSRFGNSGISSLPILLHPIHTHCFHAFGFSGFLICEVSSCRSAYAWVRACGHIKCAIVTADTLHPPALLVSRMSPGLSGHVSRPTVLHRFSHTILVPRDRHVLDRSIMVWHVRSCPRSPGGHKRPDNPGRDGLSSPETYTLMDNEDKSTRGTAS